MNTHRSLAISLVALMLVVPALIQAQSKDQLGKVDFQNSCSPAVQERFQRAVAMLHSFRYAETEKAFGEVLAHDPSCAIATWGIAAILMSNPLAGIGPSPQWAERAKAALEQGRKIGAKTSRERDYIDAVGTYYKDWANQPERTRQANRAHAFEALAARYPNDDEAKIFSALYIAATQSLADQSYQAYLKAAETLEKQFAKHPDHPGVAHYLIHSYDAPPIASKGLPAARRYASIAPAAPHALHMPSHIFTRVGSWTESIATNERSAVASKQDKDFDEQLHAMDYMVYANLQLARDAEARRVMDEGATVTGFTTLRFAGPYAQAAMPARYAIERGGHRGQEREAHRDAGADRARARAARRDAAGPQAPRRGAEGVRGLARARARALPRLLRRRRGRRAERRHGKGEALLHAAGRAGRSGRRTPGARAGARVPGGESVNARR